MKPLHVIKNPFYEWTLPEELLNDTYNLVSKLEYSDTFQNYFSLDRNIEFAPLVEFINNALNELKESLYPNMPHFGLRTTQIWSTRNGMIQKHHAHMHSNSIFSGIIYLTDHPTSGATRFSYPNIYLHHEVNSLIKPHTLALNTNQYFDLYPEQGRMIIFPSNIQHETTPNKDNKYRYVISFNSFFQGTLGHIDAATALAIEIRDPAQINLNLTKRQY